MTDELVLDACAMVDLLISSPVAGKIRLRLAGSRLHVPAHFDAEVLSALGRLHCDGRLSAQETVVRVDRLATAPIQRHPLPPLLAGAFGRRHNLRLVDALYVQLADQLGAPLITSDRALASASGAEVLSG
ncbi:MAG: type II toxin-antitoxin system VapC family toxin [Actinomycetota bacterium]